MIYDKKNPGTELIKKIIKIDETFRMNVTRNRSFDGRLNCGAGWDVKLSNAKVSYSSRYNNSRVEKENTPNPDDILDCIFSDASSGEDSANYYDFCKMFGYEPYKNDFSTAKNPEALRIYKACCKAADSLSAMFGKNLKTIYDIINNR